MRTGVPFWTNVRIERVKKLAKAGWTAGEMAREMGTTRNAVIGKLARMGVPIQSGRYCNCNDENRAPRPTQRSKSTVNAGAVIASIKAHKENPRGGKAKDLPIEPDRIPVLFADLRADQCRWPISDPAKEGFGFCGDQRRDDRVPYCACYCRIAYRPPYNYLDQDGLK